MDKGRAGWIEWLKSGEWPVTSGQVSIARLKPSQTMKARERKTTVREFLAT